MIALREGGDEDMAKWIVNEMGADVTVKAKRGEKATALHKAVKNASLDMIEFLVERGADKVFYEADARGLTPLTVAADEVYSFGFLFIG